MRRVMAICPNPRDATSFYRGVGPLSRLQKDVPDLTLVFASHVDYATLAPCDVVFLQRPSKPEHLQIAALTVNQNIPLWLDFDDDLMSVTPDNPTYHQYGDPDTKKRIAKIIKMASVITVSTKFLGDQIAPLNNNVVLVPNAIDDYQFENRRPRPVPRQKLVMWRGGSSHQRDLMTVASELVEASQDPARADWVFHFQGYHPWWITEQMREAATRHAPSLTPTDYMILLEEICPAILVVPLVDNVFNRSKSSCSWIEAAYAGAMVIAPHMPEFLRPGIINYDSPAGFAAALRDAMTGKMDIAKLADEGWAAVREDYTLTKVNPLRQRVLDILTKDRVRGYR